MNNRLTVFLLTFSILTALMLPLSAALPSADEAGVYDSVIRLHVLANSDTEEDQALKLKVRDGILITVSELLHDVTDRSIAEAKLSENLAVIESAAERVLRDNDSKYTVSVTLTKEEYPTREYSNITLPAGTYTSLRVLIGEAEGQNWWCVLFPKLCIGAETDVAAFAAVDETELVAAGLTPSQVRIITGDSPDVVVKFRILEFIGQLFS
ncbi:MAG: stage II sporulation protein R [Clostridia bacterium]|nr:stage II sporulation protein R [Clostridia bacterium]